MNILKKVFSYQILFYYSLVLATVLLIGGLATSASDSYFWVNVLFLPLPVYLWWTLHKNKKKNKSKIVNVKRIVDSDDSSEQ